MLPDLVTGEAHDRGQQSDQRLTDAPQRGLRSATSQRFLAVGIKPVLHDVDIKRTQLDDYEMIHRVIDLMKCEFLIPAHYVCGQSPGLAQDVLVHSLKPVEWNSVALRIETIQIAQNVTEKLIADVAVSFRDTLHQLF